MKTLILRDIAKNFLKLKVGDGSKIFLWLNLWHQGGVQSKLEAKLSSVIRDLDWFWQPARSNALVDVQSKLHSLNLGVRVTPIWLASKSKSYSTRDTCKSIREKNLKLIGGACFGFLWLFQSIHLFFG
jgi:hypothetical protein